MAAVRKPRRQPPDRREPSTGLRARWERIYRERSDRELSWYQPDLSLSEKLIARYATFESRALDAGGGSSSLSRKLLRAGFRHVTVVDIAAAGLRRGGGGPALEAPRRIRADLLRQPALGTVDVWHDRAVFHFLVRANDRRSYVTLVEHSVRSGGLVIVATLATEGPRACSGLPVRRYDANGLARVFGRHFVKVRSVREIHRTPWGVSQSFTYVVLRQANVGDRGRNRLSPRREKPRSQLQATRRRQPARPRRPLR